MVSAAEYEIHLPTPTRLKDIFKGWSQNAEDIQGATEIIPTENSTYYALWNPLVELTVKDMPFKTEYTMGESFEKDGLTLYATYSEGDVIEVCAAEIIVTGFDSVTAGEKTLTAEWGGKTATFTVNVKKRGEIVVSSVTGLVGKEVSVTVKLNKNPGITSANLTLDFDTEVFTLTNVSDGGIFGMQFHSDDLDSPYTLCWVNDTAEDITTEGILVTLTFVINQNAKAGEYGIGLSYSYEDFEVMDYNLNPIWLDITEGVVKVKTALTGDVDRNGFINNDDLILLTKYLANWKGFTEDSLALDAADINGDGKVNPLDRALLARYIAGWDGYDTI